MSAPGPLTPYSLQVLHVVCAWWRASDEGLKRQGLSEDKVAAQLSASDKETGRVTEEMRGILAGLAAADLIVYGPAEVGEGKVVTPTAKALAMVEGA